jgi:hypothetical protein
MARSKLSEDIVKQLLKYPRWGICDEGTAELCVADLKSVHCFQQVAAQRAEIYHRQVVHAVKVPGVQLDEAHSKLRPRQVAWIHTALAMGSWFLLWVDIGPRTQEQAATLVAQVVARVREVPFFLTDVWKATARRCSTCWASPIVADGGGRWGASQNPGSSPPSTYSTPRLSRSVTRLAIWWRSADAWSSVVRVALSRSGVFGSFGTTIQTAFMERWYGTLRGLVAPLRRRTRCLSWSHCRHRGRVWLMVSLYNFVMPHKSLRQGHTQRTPAMAIGLTDHVWSYREYIWLLVHTDRALTK